jgi:hypothetical protein
MSRWAIIDSVTKRLNNIIVAETFDIANTATTKFETPIPYTEDMGYIEVGQIYDEQSGEFVNEGEQNA